MRITVIRVSASSPMLWHVLVMNGSMEQLDVLCPQKSSDQNEKLKSEQYHPMVVQRFTEPRSQRDPGSNKIVRNQNGNNQWYLVVNVPYPNNTDVLCGRGGGTNNHPGNHLSPVR